MKCNNCGAELNEEEKLYLLNKKSTLCGFFSR